MAVWELGSSSMYKYLTSRKVIKIFLSMRGRMGSLGVV